MRQNCPHLHQTLKEKKFLSRTLKDRIGAEQPAIKSVDANSMLSPLITKLTYFGPQELWPMAFEKAVIDEVMTEIHADARWQGFLLIK